MKKKLYIIAHTWKDIDRDDVELLEAAGITEYENENKDA